MCVLYAAFATLFALCMVHPPPQGYIVTGFIPFLFRIIVLCTVHVFVLVRCRNQRARETLGHLRTRTHATPRATPAGCRSPLLPHSPPLPQVSVYWFYMKMTRDYQARTRFLKMMSHEMRTPVAGIVGLCDLYFSAANASERDAAVTDIVQNCAQLMDSIDTVLEYTRYTTMPVGRETHSGLSGSDEFSPVGVVEALVGTFARMNRVKPGVLLRAECSERADEHDVALPAMRDMMVRGSRGRVTQGESVSWGERVWCVCFGFVCLFRGCICACVFVCVWLCIFVIVLHFAHHFCDVDDIVVLLDFVSLPPTIPLSLQHPCSVDYFLRQCDQVHREWRDCRACGGSQTRRQHGARAVCGARLWVRNFQSRASEFVQTVLS